MTICVTVIPRRRPPGGLVARCAGALRVLARAASVRAASVRAAVVGSRVDAEPPAEGGVPTAELILRFQRGQPRAFEALYDRYKNYVYRVAFFLVRNREEAEDAVQETFLDVLKALPTYDVHGPARFTSWLYRVTVNRTRMRHRRKRLPSVEWDDVEARLERLPLPSSARPETALLDRERATQVWEAVEGLSDLHREVIVLRYQCELSYQEIAQVLGVRLGTVKSRLYNAHRRLREALAAL